MWSAAEWQREESANSEHWSIYCRVKPAVVLADFAQATADVAPHFYALSQGKQTEPCSAGTWLVLPPLLWVNLKSSQYERHGTSFDWSWLYVFECRQPSLHPSSRPSRMTPKLNFSQCLQNVWAAHWIVLHCTRCCIMFCFFFNITASWRWFQQWLPKWHDTHVCIM